MLVTSSRGHVFLRVGACHGKYHLAEFGVSRSSANGDVMYLIYEVTSEGHVLKWSCDFTGGSHSQHIAEFGFIKHCGSGDITF